MKVGNGTFKCGSEANPGEAVWERGTGMRPLNEVTERSLGMGPGSGASVTVDCSSCAEKCTGHGDVKSVQ